MNTNAFEDDQRQGLYRAIYERRDVRSQFLPDPVPEAVLARLLHAAHHAPSVGFMQPWDFILIDDLTIRTQVKALFDEANLSAAQRFAKEGDPRARLYPQLKLEGILDAPLNLCITCDRRRGGPTVLGRTAILEMDLFSACLAVQNLWLAARAEGSALAGSVFSTISVWRICYPYRNTSIHWPTCVLAMSPSFCRSRSWLVAAGNNACPSHSWYTATTGKATRSPRC